MMQIGQKRSDRQHRCHRADAAAGVHHVQITMRQVEDKSVALDFPSQGIEDKGG
jgi:hypothetical protein